MLQCCQRLKSRRLFIYSHVNFIERSNLRPQAVCWLHAVLLVAQLSRGYREGSELCLAGI